VASLEVTTLVFPTTLEVCEMHLSHTIKRITIVISLFALG